MLDGPVWECCCAFETTVGVEDDEVGSYGVVSDCCPVALLVAEGGDDAFEYGQEVVLGCDEGAVGVFGGYYFVVLAVVGVGGYGDVVCDVGVAGVVGECVDYEVGGFGVKGKMTASVSWTVPKRRVGSVGRVCAFHAVPRGVGLCIVCRILVR